MINLPQRFIKDIHSVIETLIKEIDNHLEEIILFVSNIKRDGISLWKGGKWREEL